jgi:hypothetical protein
MRTAIRPIRQDVYAVVLVASAQDWQELRDAFPELRPGSALGSEWTSRAFGRKRVVFVNTGEDTVSAAAIAQHAADHWRPSALLMPGSTAGSAVHAFQWVAERNRIPLRNQPSMQALLAELSGVPVLPSEPDAMIPLADSSSE